ncbi:MAG: type II toxin-antitoxin system VapC family toxin [Proteobacteria bacterium]|nr:type II toxin-antitoxin system VapC family toxin [Pseudomonadota bacterium]
MAWVVDTCLLLDIGLDDPEFAEGSENLVLQMSSSGVVISPVTFVELAPAFGGNMDALKNFLFGLGIDFEEIWDVSDTENAAAAWAEHILKRRSGGFALRFEGLLTRNAKDFQKLFPNLRVVEP